MPNDAGAVEVELTIPLSILCSYVGEPQPGSTLTWRYAAGERILALGACRSWPATQMSAPLDLETFTRRAADDASAALGVPVEAIGYYILKDGTVLRCRSS
jgi:7-cyano-7-deazaguanine reductase